MEKLRFRTYILMAAVLLWGVLLGGVVYSHMVFFPVFLSNLPESSIVVNGPYGLDESRFWMTIHPILLLTLIISLIANWRDRRRRSLIAASFTVYVIVLVVSALFFVPELIAFHDSPGSALSPPEWAARARRWEYLSWTRGTVLFIFAIPLLLALARAETADENSR